MVMSLQPAVIRRATVMGRSRLVDIMGPIVPGLPPCDSLETWGEAVYWG
jgi:hypothetical protein